MIFTKQELEIIDGALTLAGSRHLAEAKLADKRNAYRTPAATRHKALADAMRVLQDKIAFATESGA